MPKVNKKERLDRFYEAIMSLKTVDEVEDFFLDICTTTELTTLEQRYAVAELLMQDKVYTDILKRTNASTSTISRVKRVLNEGSGMLPVAIERVNASHPKTEEET